MLKARVLAALWGKVGTCYLAGKGMGKLIEVRAVMHASTCCEIL